MVSETDQKQTGTSTSSNPFSRAFDRLLSATGVAAMGLVALMAFMVLGVSLGRSLFRINIPGLFDGAVYALLVLPFLTMAFAMRQGRHIIIDSFITRLSPRALTVLNIATYSVSLFYVGILGWQTAKWTPQLYRQGAMTAAVFDIPKWIPVAVMAFGSALLFIQILRVLATHIRALPRTEKRSRENVWLPAALFVLGVAAGILLLMTGSKIWGIAVIAFVLLFSGVPVFLAFGLMGTLGLYFLMGPGSLLQVPITAYGAMYSFPLTCLPLFILGGLIMESSGIADDIFRFLGLWVGRWAVSPLLVTVAMGMMFDAVSGSTAATHAVVGAVALPILFKRGYNKALCCGVVGGAALGTLIPPSTGYVVYAVLTDESVGALFMGTLLPSIGLFVSYFLFVIILGMVAKRALFEGGKIPESVEVTNVSWRDRWDGLKVASWGMLTPVIVMGGIATGMFTPTEVAAVLVVYAIIVSVVVKRASWRSVIASTLKSAEISAMLLCIIFSAFIFAQVISQMQVSNQLVAYARETGMGAGLVIGILFMVLLIFGMFMEAVSIKVVTLPVFYPLAQAVGIDGVWLGVFYQFMMELAGLTPPMGLSLFIIRGITGLPMNVIVKGNIPFILLMVLSVALMFFFPQIVTWLPSVLVTK